MSKHLRSLVLGLLICFTGKGMALASGDPAINFNRKPLPEALDQLTEKSGIQFTLPDSLSETMISGRFQDSNWSDLTRHVLEKFNLVEVGDGSGSLAKVFILGIKDETEIIIEATPIEKPARVKRPLKVSDIQLSMGQLKQLSKGPFRKPLPAHLYANARFKEFMALQGISSQEEMKDISKAMRVRVEARRQLKLLHNSSRKKVN